MAYKFKSIEKTIGFFIVFACLLLIAALIFIAKGQNLIMKKNYYKSTFNSASDLTVGMPIKFKGLKIGAVKSLELDNENKIAVDFYILREFANRIKTDSILKVNAPLIGEKTLEITAGSKDSELALKHSIIYSIDSEKGRELLKAQTSEQALTPTDLIIQNMQLLTAELSDPTGSFMSTLKNLQKFSGAFAESYGANKDNFTKMITDLQVVVANFKEMSYSMKSNPLLGGGWSGSDDSTKKKKKQ